MNIVTPYAKMVGPGDAESPFVSMDGISLLRRVEFFGRISHKSEGKQTPDSWDKFLRAVVLGHGDWSITEHVVISVDAVVDRGITHEWVRHRIAAYTQESTRFVNYAKKHTNIEEYVNPVSFICPPAILATNTGDQRTPYSRWLNGRQADEDEYISHIDWGIKPQEARTCLPNATAARLASTYNLRMWRHFFLMRTTKEAHPQMREVSIPLLAEFKAKIPIIFDDIKPEARQVDNLFKPR